MTIHNATSFSVGCLDDRYGMVAEARDRMSSFAILLWSDRVVLHDAMVRAASAPIEQPVIVSCACGKADCTTRALLSSELVVLERCDGVLHVDMGGYDYASFAFDTSDAYEADRVAMAVR